MAKVVITCPGAFSLYDTDSFGGALFDSPNTRIASPTWGWQNWGISDSWAEIDMDNMYDLIADHIDDDDGLIVAGHSRGAQIIYKLLRERLDDLTANIDPDRILFISSGNPERKYHGKSYLRPDEYPTVYPGPGSGGAGVGYGLPSGGIGEFRLYDIARQYDEWADYPDDWDVSAAIDAVDEANVHSSYDGAAHLDADGEPLDWRDWAHWTEGTVTYLISPATSPLSPAAKSFSARCHGGDFQRHRLEDTSLDDSKTEYRRGIEVAYERQVPVYAKAVG